MGDVLLGVDITVVKTSTEGPEWPLGTRYEDPKTGKEYRYINADTAITAGDALTETISDADNPWSLVPAAAVALPLRGIAVSTIAAEGFGWMQTKGKRASANVADAAAQGDYLVTTATAGRLGAFIAFTTVDPTKTQLDAGMAFSAGVRARAISDGSASNLGDVFLW